MYGARTSLLVGVVASGIAVLIGLVVGLHRRLLRGWIDTALSRVGDVMLAMPQLLISIGIVAACSSTRRAASRAGSIQPGIALVIAIIVLFSWPYIARIVRGYTLSIREKEFVEASRSLGAGNTRIIFREILPNLIGPDDRLHDAPDPAEHPVRGGALVPRARRAARRPPRGAGS